MTNKRTDVTTLAKKNGTAAKYRADPDGLEHEIVIPAPIGYVWTCSGIHELVICGADGTPWSDLYADAVERMTHGVERCIDPDCDICPLSTEKTPSGDDWDKAEARANRKRHCSYCGDVGHVMKTCPKYLRKHLGQ